MTKIIQLFCTNGYSTNMLAEKMKKVCHEKGIDYDISAHPISEVENYAKDAHVILIAPPVYCRLKGLKELYSDKIVRLVQPIDYCNGDAQSIIKRVQGYLKGNY